MPDEKLATRIRDAKGGKRLPFAFASKGSEGGLIVAKTISADDITQLKKDSGGTTVYRGKCVGEGGILYFETTKDVPGTLSMAVKKVIKRDAGLSLDVLFRQRDDADAPETGKAGPKLEMDTGPSEVSKTKPPEQVEAEARLAAIERTFTVELTGKGEKAVKAQKLVADTKTLIAAKNYAGAHLKMNDLETLTARSPQQVQYEELLRANRTAIEAAQGQRGGPQIKIYYDQATTAATAQDWAKALKALDKARTLTAAAAARNPYLAALDSAKGKVEPLLAVKVKPEAPNAEAITAAVSKLNAIWTLQDKHAKKPDYVNAKAAVEAALTVATAELEPLIREKATAAKSRLADAETAIGGAMTGLATATAETRAAKLAEARRAVADLFATTDAAKELGVTNSGVQAAGGAAPDRQIPCEKFYKQYDWFELKRRFNLPEKPGVLPENRENITAGEMKQLWNWRSSEVDKLIDSLRSKYPTLIAKACGSNDLESDIDITFSTPGEENFGDDIKAAKEFNERVIARFGKPAGRTFDVNIYARDYRPIKESRNAAFNADPIADVGVDQPSDKPVAGMDFRNASAEDQDVAALMKQRRFMSAKQWAQYSANILADVETQIRAKNPQADLKKDKNYQQVAKQLDEAEDVFLLSLRKMLVGIQKGVLKRHPEMADDEKFKRLEQLLSDPNAKDIAAEMQKLQKELNEGKYAALTMEATDEMYLDMMAEVRENQKKLTTMPEGEAKEALKLQVKKDLFTNIFFANEAYTSEGAITHIVAGSQAGLTTEQLGETLKPTETVQSANEQLADLLKDMEHYEDEEHKAREEGGAEKAAAVAGQAFVHASKYLERLLDATAILATQFSPKKPGDPEAPQLAWFGTYVKDGEVTGKPTLKEKAETLQKRIKKMLLALRKTDKVPGDLKKAIAVDEVKQVFNVETIEAFTAIMLKLGQELNSVVRQRAQFSSAVEVGEDVTKSRMKNVDLGVREQALNVVRKFTKDPKAVAPTAGLTTVFTKLDLGTPAECGKLATELCTTWQTALTLLEQRDGDKLGKVLPLLAKRIKAIPDIEVANEFQNVERWIGQSAQLLEMTSGAGATPRSQEVVANINRAEVLSSRIRELLYGAKWDAVKQEPTTEAKDQFAEDMAKLAAQVDPVQAPLTVDVIDDLPPAIKQRITDAMTTLNVLGNDITRRKVELAKLPVTAPV